MSSHRLTLTNGWSLWRDFAVRGAGFGVGLLDGFASSMLGQEVDDLISAEDHIEELRRSAVEIGARPWGDHPPADRKLHASTLRKLRDRRAPTAMNDDSELARAVDRLLSAQTALEEKLRATLAVFEEHAVRTKSLLRSVAADPRLRAALAWQNRDLLAHAIDPLSRTPATATDAKTRQRELTLASYLQRYCAKSDTIGFFGPIAFGRFERSTQLIYAESFIGHKRVYFEHWGINDLAIHLSKSRDLRAALCPRWSPLVRMDGTTLHFLHQAIQLPAPFLATFALCDGKTSAADIAARLLARPELELDSREEALDLLDELTEKRLLIWALEVPTSNYEPDTALSDAARTLGPAATAELRDVVETLERLRDSLERATTAEEIDGSQAELERAYSGWTSRDATRAAGKTYAARTLCYLEAARDLRFSLSEDHAAALSAPLELLLQAGRWYTYEIARRFRALCSRELTLLQEKRGVVEIEYAEFWEHVSVHLGAGSRDLADFVKDVVSELQRRWFEVLRPYLGRAKIDSAQLTEAVATAFAAPGPGWPSARFQAPDLMIAARDLNDTDLQYVIGELHVGGETFTQFRHMFREPDAFADAIDEDIPGRRMAPVIPAVNALLVRMASASRTMFDLETGNARSHRARDRVLAVADLVVARTPKGMVVRDRAGIHSFELIAAFEHFLSGAAVSHFQLLSPQPHWPRVTIDRLVVSRERWTFATADLAFWRQVGSARLIATRRWARSLGLPRYLFYKVPNEIKPYYLDLESPLFVDLFCKVVSGASVVHLSEMLPTPEQSWLSDANGERYVSELRMVAVDPIPYAPDDHASPES